MSLFDKILYLTFKKCEGTKNANIPKRLNGRGVNLLSGETCFPS